MPSFCFVRVILSFPLQAPYSSFSVSSLSHFSFILFLALSRTFTELRPILTELTICWLETIVSAGNTGATLAMTVLKWRSLPAVSRPALAAVINLWDEAQVEVADICFGTGVYAPSICGAAESSEKVLNSEMQYFRNVR